MSELLLPVRIAKKILEAHDIYSFELVAQNGESLPAFSAGAHIDVHGPTGLVRQYSLCNDPGERFRYLIAVLRDPQSRGGSAAMHDHLNVGDLIQISMPKNHFAMASDAKHALLLAGGIGITPIICMAEYLANLNEKFEMHYLARSCERTAFYERINTSAFCSNVVFHFDDGAGDQKLDISRLLATPAEGTHLYVWGPGGFLEWVLSTARGLNWPENRIHYEYFSAATLSNGSERPFSVKIASSGKIYPVAADKSVAIALLEHGVDIPVSCEQGICGTCITGVLEGVPEHRDHYFTDAEKAANNQFTPCCSRSYDPLLVLDL